MEEQEQPRSLRRKLMRNSFFIFIGFVFIILCFVFLGIAQQQQNLSEVYCEDCHGSNKPRVFRLLAATCFIFGFTLMTVFWWHVKAIRSAYVLRQRRLELERLIGNNNHRRVRRANTMSLGLRNNGWLDMVDICPGSKTFNTSSYSLSKRVRSQRNFANKVSAWYVWTDFFRTGFLKPGY